ncbi:MAG TPA: 5-(carboxyamino)imidazole ribonucleotide synthase [Xanthomonadales bacterium]|nr:5-(carboxyamino)imidazole ribonucleotide synthase [Xanthomonadales bacterium]
MARGRDQGADRVGILGGGQLARMLALAGIPLGCKFFFLDPSAGACAATTGTLYQANFSDLDAVRALAAEIDVATFDFENVPAEVAREMGRLRPFHPSVAALEFCQDRLLEKRLLLELGIPVPLFHAVDARPDLMAAIDRIGFPAVLKTRRLGYDGKGQRILRQPEDLEPAWQSHGGSELILEAFVPFDAECSQLAVRDAGGEVRFWPLTRNVHDNSVLVLSQPGVLGRDLQNQAEHYINLLFDRWQYVGVMAVEFFVLDGELQVNEIAPRVHNSGHWTIDAAVTSQFENHLRAILGLPLGDTSMTSFPVMFNWIGELPDRNRLLAIPGLHWHDYGKSARPGRKIGHATVTATDQATLMNRCSQMAAELGGNWAERLALLQSSAGQAGSASPSRRSTSPETLSTISAA